MFFELNFQKTRKQQNMKNGLNIFYITFTRVEFGFHGLFLIDFFLILLFKIELIDN
jgi:hypothetical protein